MSETPDQPATEPTTETPETKTEATTEPKAEEGKGLLSKDAPKDEPPADPITAEAITLPEGVEVDSDTMTSFLDLANEYGLDAEAANKLVNLQASVQEKAAEQLSQFWETTQEEWKNQSREALGDKFDQSLGNIRQLIDQYGDDSVYEVMNNTGAGNHPAIIQMLAKVASELVKEAEPVSGAPSSSPQDRAHRMFPSMN